MPEPPSLKATLVPRQSGAGWDLGNPCQMIPSLGLSLGLRLWYTTIIPKFRRLRQENFELEASLYHTARPYLEGWAGGGGGELSLGLGERVQGTNTVVSPRVRPRPCNSSQLSERLAG